MKNTSKLPLADQGRVAELARLGIYGPTGDEVLQSFVKDAAEEMDLPISLVSVILNGAQVFSASHGLMGWLEETQATPIEWSFCVNSVESREPFVVEDASNHERVKDNPLVTVDGVRCYAGAPMITKNGYVIGNFCVIGDAQRSFSEQEISRIKEYAQMAVDRLEQLATHP